jgi:geranylgeranyl diphosphate synthase type II
VLRIYKACKADEWTIQLKNRYFEEAINHLEDIAVISRRKVPLRDLAVFLLKRDY